MLHKEIENKAQAKRAAKELAADLRNELKIYDGYTVSVKEHPSQVHVQVTPDLRKRSSAIITDSAHYYVNNVVKLYKMKYQFVNHHIEVAEIQVNNVKHLVPALVVCFLFTE